MRRFARPLLNVVIAGGLLLAVWPLGQTLYGRWSQRELAAQWQREQATISRHSPLQASKRPQTNHQTVEKASRANRRPRVALASASKDAPTMSVAPSSHVKPWPLTKLSIPDIGLDTFVVQGWDDPSLRRGPGHLPQSAPAGQGNCIVAGHRNVYGSPFYRLEELMPGQTITLTNRSGTFNYIVNAVFPTPDTNTQILGVPPANEPPRLTLLTCTLPHTNNRIVVQALLSTSG